MKSSLAKYILVLTHLVFCTTHLSFAQEYPSKPIKIVIPFPPGGGADVLMRPLSKKLSELLGQTIILDNKPGANGNIGADYVAKSSPDGYTLLLGNSSLPISSALYTQLNFDQNSLIMYSHLKEENRTRIKIKKMTEDKDKENDIR